MFIQTSFGGNSPPKVLSFPSNDLPSSCSETITFDFLTVSFLPLPKKPTPLSALGLDFRPFGLHSVVSTNSLHFPPMLRGLDKTLHHIPRTCSPQAHLGIFRPYLDHWRLLVTSGEGCQASRRPSDASTPYYSSTKNLNNQACQSWWIVRI